MTFTIDPEQFLIDSLQRILKQVHLSEKYELEVFDANQIPARIKKISKDFVPGDFFNGVKAKIIALKAKNVSDASDDDKIKIADFVRTTFFLSKSSEYSSNDVHKVIDYGSDRKSAKDDDKDQSEAKAVFFFTKMELLK